MNYKFKLANGSIFDFELEKGDIVVDCGANVGIFTDLFQKLGAIVYAFEPNPYAFKVLNERFDTSSSVFLKKQAVSTSKRKGIQKFFFHKEHEKDKIEYSQGSSLLSEKPNVNKEDYVDVEVIDFSEFITSLSKDIKILKIDIEGAEVELIHDLIDKNLIQGIPYVFVETHDRKILDLREETNRLRKRIKENNLNNIRLDWI